MHSYAKLCKVLQSFAKLCKNVQTHAKICRLMRSYAKICRYMQSNAELCRVLQSNTDRTGKRDTYASKKDFILKSNQHSTGHANMDMYHVLWTGGKRSIFIRLIRTLQDKVPIANEADKNVKAWRQ